MNRQTHACLKRLEYCRRLLNDMVDYHPNAASHLCTKELCRPLNEADMVRLGVLPPHERPIQSNVWLCRYGSYHVCSEHECNRAVEGVCPISGAASTEYVNASDYNATDSRTYNAARESTLVGSENPTFLAPAPKKRRRTLANLFGPCDEPAEEVEVPPVPPPPLVQKKKHTTGRLGMKEARVRVERLTYTLLYDNSLRKKVHARQVEHYNKQKATAWAAYETQCAQHKRVMNLIHQMICDSNLLQSMPPFIDANVEYSEPRHTYYIEAALRLYKLACVYLQQPKLDVEALAMAMLHQMRKGMTLEDGLQVLPMDTYILALLPQSNDFPLFHCPKKKFFNGMRLLKELYRSAATDGATREELQMHVFEEPEREHVFMPRAREWKKRH